MSHAHPGGDRYHEYSDDHMEEHNEELGVHNDAIPVLHAHRD